MTDVGRRFRFSRVIELVVELDENDVSDGHDNGESAEETAVLIAGCNPINEWSLGAIEMEELSS